MKLVDIDLTLTHKIDLEKFFNDFKVNIDIQISEPKIEGDYFIYNIKLLSRKALEYFGRIERKEKKPRRRKR